VSGRLDALQWKVPLTAIGHRHEDGALIDNDGRAPSADTSPPQATSPADALGHAPEPVIRSAAAAADTMVRRNSVLSPAEPRVEPVIPLVHAPDDPGPESHAEPGSTSEAPADPWWRIRLFK
jgi:HemY protein